MERTSADTAAVLACEEQRRCALLAADGAALDRLLDEALVFVHSTGVRDDRASYRAKVADRVIEYLELAFLDLGVDVRDGVAIVSGRMEARVRRDGQERPVRSLYLTVWQRDRALPGAPWRLRAHQGTPMA